jgi:hypothetical protein
MTADIQLSPFTPFPFPKPSRGPTPPFPSSHLFLPIAPSIPKRLTLFVFPFVLFNAFRLNEVKSELVGFFVRECACKSDSLLCLLPLSLSVRPCPSSLNQPSFLPHARAILSREIWPSVFSPPCPIHLPPCAKSFLNRIRARERYDCVIRLSNGLIDCRLFLLRSLDKSRG